MRVKPRILVVDDEAMNTEVLKINLGNSYEIRTVNNGPEAIRQCKVFTPDLILLDVLMPGLSGFEVARSIKADKNLSDIPIIFVTILDNFDGEFEGLESGGIDYVTKPFNKTLLNLRVRNHLELKRKKDDLKEQYDTVLRQKEELHTAFSRIRRLEGMISICMHCKSIRDESAAWLAIERYIMDNSDANFSHGICPDCLEKHYPSL